MNRPDERKRLYNLWSVARRSSNPSEAATARAMLARLQAQLGLSDAEVAFIAENEEKAPISSDDSEQPPNAFELLLHVFEVSAIILNFAQEAAKIGGLEIQLVYYRGLEEFQHSGWTTKAQDG